MRIYADFKEAFNEIRRDLAELSIEVQPETQQDKYVADDPDYLTKELYNYDYQVLRPHPIDIEGIHRDWVIAEWQERLRGGSNPGLAWRLRKEYWEDYLEPGGTFSYTYSGRMGGGHIAAIIDELKKHPHSRQLWLPVWWPEDALKRGQRRVPCSLGYWLVNRENRLHMTYVMRSCDFVTHFPNDVWLANQLQLYISSMADIQMGTFTHFIGSLHVYAKDVAGVF